MKSRRICLIAGLIGSLHAVAAAAPLTISCETLNPVNHQPQTVFHPGDKVEISITTNFSELVAIGRRNYSQRRYDYSCSWNTAVYSEEYHQRPKSSGSWPRFISKRH